MDWNSRIAPFSELPKDVQEDLLEVYGDKIIQDMSEEYKQEIVRTKGLEKLTAYEVLDAYLKYNGIIGYTTRFIRVFEAIEGAAESSWTS